MPRRPRAARRNQAAAPPPPPSQEQVDARYGESISQNKLKALLRSAKTTQASMAELSGALGQQISNAIEDNHLHRKAFNIVKSMDKMDDEKLAECWHWLKKYFAMAGLQDRVDTVITMAFGPGDGAPETAVDDEGQETESGAQPAQARTANIRAFPRPTSVAAE